MANNEVSYDLLPGIRRSDLWKIHRSPYHFRYEMDHTTKKTPALIFGAAAHKLILEADTFMDEYAVSPVVDRRTREGKAVWAEFVEKCKAEHLEVVSADDYLMIKDMNAAIDAHPIARRLLSGRHEQIFTWTDTKTGERCKIRTDCLTEYRGRQIIVDYKTTDSCEDGAFERSCRKYGYKFQAGMYHEGVFQNTLEDRDFVFVVQEKNEPYAVRCYYCAPEFVKEGYDQFRELIGIYHDCKERDYWPGYEGMVGDIDWFTELLGEG